MTPQVVVADPAPARLMANLLRYAGTAPAPAAKVLVVGSGPNVEALRDDLGVQADFVDTMPAALPALDLLIIGDLGKGAGDAAIVRTYVAGGGRVLITGMANNSDAWLGQLLGDKPLRGRLFSCRSVKITDDPLLQGIGDGDMMYNSLAYTAWERFIRPTPNPQDLIRDYVVPTAGRALTWPPALAVQDIEAGQVVLCNARWAEVDRKTRAYWGFDARRIGSGMMRTLLLNLGARCKLPEPPKDTTVAGYVLTPLDISGAFNREFIDAEPNDGTGWIDIGPNYDARAIAPGAYLAGGIRFDIPEQRAIVLAGAKKLTNQPPETEPIPVGRTVDGLGFLQAAGYLGWKDGTAAWEYEVRYAGYAALTAGADTSAFCEKVQLRSNVDVGDWLGNSMVPPSWRLEEKRINLFAQFWVNPRPDRVVESIVVRSHRVSEVPMVFAISIASPAPNLLDLDIPASGDFTKRNKGWNTIASEGQMPFSKWAYGAWQKEAVIEISGRADPDGTRFIRLANIEGAPALMLFRKNAVAGKKGQSYRRFRYRCRGTATVMIKQGGTELIKRELKPNLDWQFVSIPVQLEQDGALTPEWRVGMLGDDFGLDLSEVQVWRVDGGRNQEPAQRCTLGATPNATLYRLLR
ncbi:MAG: hypothetical protein PF961_17945 [Planctomycetota bacterium]|jgi:hypothetical protein|nr:hypothetical protein [Planctomycetota bacterium]